MRSLRFPRLAGTVLSCAVVVLTACRPAGAAPLAHPTSITVDAGQAGQSVPSTAVGINTAVWDHDLLDKAVPPRLRQIRTSVIRYPGGSTSDQYHWQDNSITPGSGGAATVSDTFDHFMQRVVIPVHAQAMITVNYGSNADGTGGGDPNEAAAWVNYANNVKHYGIKYWEIGNEIYGNGYYGAHWETDLHTDHSPTAYATNALQFIDAMKAKDRSIKVGLVLTAPGNWPDGQGPQQWNQTVLSIAGKQADFAIVHWYPQNPGQESDSGLLNSPSTIPGMVARLKADIAQYAGHPMDIVVTETNSVSSNPGKQTTSSVNGLFLIEDYLGWLREGVQNVDWWDLHDSAQKNNNSKKLAGKTRYGDYGVLSAGELTEPRVNTPLPAYIALALLARAVVPNSTFVSSTSSAANVRVYALRQPQGLRVVLVNVSRSASASAHLSVSGMSTSKASASGFSLKSPHLHSVKVSKKLTLTLPPYSATVVHLH
jgi:hypothetical protein